MLEPVLTKIMENRRDLRYELKRDLKHLHSDLKLSEILQVLTLNWCYREYQTCWSVSFSCHK